MSDTTQAIPDNIKAARESFSGRGLTDVQFHEAWAIAGILHGEIRQTGSFREKLTDYAHAYSRSERFDALRGETILRDIYGGRFGQTLNATRKGLEKAAEALPDMARTQALDAAERIVPMIKQGQTMPFYQAYDAVAATLAKELEITCNGAKMLMKETYQGHHGAELYAAGKDAEVTYHKPAREAEIAAQKQEAQSGPRATMSSR